MIERLKEIFLEYAVGYEAVLMLITLLVLLAGLYVVMKK